MTVHVLVVEDDPDFSGELNQILTGLSPRISVTHARSRDSAIRLIAERFFDLIVLDLSLPTVDEALDEHPDNGHAVFNQARNTAPGTPLFVLTGSSAEAFVRSMLKWQEQVDIWGQSRKVSTLTFLRKMDIADCPPLLSEIVQSVEQLFEVELDRGEARVEIEAERIIRIFTRSVNGTRCAISVLGGGLSDASVFKLRVTNEYGSLLHEAVAKLGDGEMIRDEARRYNRYVARLNPEATPRLLDTFEHGAGRLAGNFYGLVQRSRGSAFDLALGPAEESVKVVRSIEKATARWTLDTPQTRRRISDVRRRVLSDVQAEQLIHAHQLKWAPLFETEHIQTRWASIHGDLHGGNVLISEGDLAMLIDYGDVGEGPASLDPVSLELSLLFHPQISRLNSWPTLAQAKRWGWIEEYLQGCPASDFVRECRAWADRSAAGRRETAASAYSYLLRRLKYDDTNKELAIALLTGVKSFYDAT